MHTVLRMQTVNGVKDAHFPGTTRGLVSLFLVERPGSPSSVLAPSSDALCS